MLSENKLVDLCHKYQTHKLTESEFQLLQSWVNESEENLRFFSNYVKLYKAGKRIEASQTANATKGWTAIERKLRQHRLRRKLYYTAVAACFLSFLLGTAVYFYSYQDTSLPAEETSLAELFPNLPQNKVTLTLNSGQQIVLDEEQAKEIADNGKVVAKGTNNSLSYQPDTTTPATGIQYNTITVPEGSTFSLTLSDGTQVTLNSTTTFRYPVSMQDKRTVELNGEAYFDVTHTGQPFIVKADGKEIKVLGTQFNVSAYHSRNMVTTLVKGKVEVKNGIARKLLVPGQQAVIHPEDNAITVEEVNTNIYTSWVTGIYEFSKAPLHNILSQFELWYGVKVVYKDKDARDICFDGAVFRNKPLGFSLEIIQQVSNVRFAKENGTITVSKQLE